MSTISVINLHYGNNVSNNGKVHFGKPTLLCSRRGGYVLAWNKTSYVCRGNDGLLKMLSKYFEIKKQEDVG